MLSGIRRPGADTQRPPRSRGDPVTPPMPKIPPSQVPLLPPHIPGDGFRGLGTGGKQWERFTGTGWERMEYNGMGRELGRRDGDFDRAEG